MGLTTVLENAVGRAARWGWKDEWQSQIVSTAETVRCPTRADVVSTDLCRVCPRLVDLRAYSDGGGSVRMVICQKDDE